MKTLVIYDGPSVMPSPGFGEPVIALLTQGSTNSKTGNMPTLWVLPKDVGVWEAVRSGADACVCGDCPQRKTAVARDAPLCYTYGNVLRAAVSMQKAHHKGNQLDATKWSVRQLTHYLECSARYGGVKAIRSAAYGDAAALPLLVWQKLDEARRQAGLGIRGYTHQWRWATHLRLTHMASAHTLQDIQASKAEGWRHFLSNDEAAVDAILAQPGVDDAMCPASKEAGYLTNCTNCTACSGLTRGATSPSRYIYDHGPGAQGRRLVKTTICA